MKTLLTLLSGLFLAVSFTQAQQNPVLLGPIDPGNSDTFSGWMSRDVANGYMYFKMYDGTGSEIHPTNYTARVGCLWRTDGSPAGTNRYASAQVVGDVRVIDGLVYFTGADPNANNWDDPWRSDGTPSGTYRLIDLGKNMWSSSSEWDFESFNGAVYFRHHFRRKQTTTPVYNLMSTDGTSSGTGIVSSVDDWIFDLTPIGSDLFLTTYDLWISDGSSTGTVLLKDICPSTYDCWPLPYVPFPRPYEDAYYYRPFVMNGTYYSRHSEGVKGAELWKSDGTPTGTVMVKDINSGAGSSWPCMFAEMNGILYFAAYDEANGFELWKSDGTAAGTNIVKDINPYGNSEPLWITTSVPTLVE